MTRKNERKYYGVNIGLTPVQHQLLDEVREQIKARIGVELSRAEAVQFLSHFYKDKEKGNDNQA